MRNSKTILIIAGEESGDQHAAAFVKQMRNEHPHLIFVGVGGMHLQAAGMQLLANLAQYGVTGVSEVFRHLRIIKQTFNKIKKYLLAHRVDLIVLVDYPGFNLRFAKYVKHHYNIPIVYYIGPQIWAWKANRINTIKKNIDHMAVILPFEKSIYKNANVPVSFVGHPLSKLLKMHHDKSTLQKQLHLPQNKRVIAILPGSRKNEIQKLMPILVKCMQDIKRRYPDVHFALPIAGSLNPKLISRYLTGEVLPLQLFNQRASEVIAASDCAIVASGTASLECALLATPGCIIYKASPLTAVLARALMRVPYLGLANIIANAPIMPEFIQEQCTPALILKEIDALLQSAEYYNQQRSRLLDLRSQLHQESADLQIHDLLLKFVDDSLCQAKAPLN